MAGGPLKPRVLIGYSCCPLTLEAFERAGCDAWTCDILPSRGRPDRHIQGDIWSIAGDHWHAAIFHPMCTNLTVSASWAFNDPDFDRWPGIGYHQRVKPETLTGGARRAARDADLANFQRLLDLPYPKAIENPGQSFVSTAIRPADQIIQPNWFGDNASKGTGLWLDRLPKLRKGARAQGRIVDDGRAQLGLFGTGVERWANQTDSGQNKLPPSHNRWLDRSATYPGIAAAMGEQWGGFLIAQLSRSRA